MKLYKYISAQSFILLVFSSTINAVDIFIDDTVIIDDQHAPDKHHGIGWERDGKRIGKWLFYYKSNNAYEYRSYNSMGVLDGQWLDFYEQGGLAVVGQFENGKQAGIWIGYHESGKIRYFANYGDSIIGFMEKPIMEWFTNDGTPKKEGVVGIIKAIEIQIRKDPNSK